MLKYTLKRLLYLIPVVIGATLIVFLLLQLSAGDPARILLSTEATPETVESLREEMGLNDPILVQYGRYMLNLLKGDMGISYKSGRTVYYEISSRFPNTAKLAVASLVIGTLMALPLGIWAAIKQNTFIDAVGMFISLLGMSIPIFWLGLVFQIVFSLKLGWFPVSGSEGLKSLILPAFALAARSMASIARMTRSSMLEVIRQDYIRTARSKGIPEWQVIRRHALRNSLIPTITVIGIQLGSLMGGAILVETVFAWPGIGRLMIQAINGRDVPVVLGCIVVLAGIYAAVNLLVDLIYTAVDPRMRSQFL
jgi:peptide/nickel transport system permease protein